MLNFKQTFFNRFSWIYNVNFTCAYLLSINNLFFFEWVKVPHLGTSLVHKEIDYTTNNNFIFVINFIKELKFY